MIEPNYDAMRAEIIFQQQRADKAEEQLKSMARSLLRVSYSREEMEAKLRQWMVQEFGNPRDYSTEPDQRNAWYRDNGLLYHFICDHFPAENRKEV